MNTPPTTHSPDRTGEKPKKVANGLLESRQAWRQHYRRSYHFWRNQGLAPICSLRYAIYYNFVGTQGVK
jgi:hypothetical protein